jgi:peptidyl-prolyl cis-trans isomerase SurA
LAHVLDREAELLILPATPPEGTGFEDVVRLEKTSPLLRKTVFIALLGASLSCLGAPLLEAQNAAAPVAATGELPAAESPKDPHRLGNGVAAIVNDSIVSDYDLRQRIALFMATSGVKPTEDTMRQIRAQVLKQLETERLQLQEALHKNISVSGAEVDKAVDNIIKENHLTLDQLKGMLAQSGVAMATLRTQIATEIAWSKAVQDQFTDRIDISPSDVDEEMKRIAEGAKKPHFLVAEIFLSVDNPEQDEKVRKDAEGLETQLRAGAPFNTVARQFSQNPSAAEGGNIGWVHEGQLAPELNNALEKLGPGEVTPPIRSTGGYYILALRQRQEGAGTKLPDPSTLGPTLPPGMMPLARILLPTGPKPEPALLQNAMKAAGVIRDHIDSCDHLDEMTKKIQGAVYMNLGMIKLADLSPEIQQAMAHTEPGDVAPPFQSDAGIEIIVRCDKALPKLTAFQMPSRQAVEQELFETQITALSRQYMRDLRRSADVEDR